MDDIILLGFGIFILTDIISQRIWYRDDNVREFSFIFSLLCTLDILLIAVIYKFLNLFSIIIR